MKKVEAADLGGERVRPREEDEEQWILFDTGGDNSDWDYETPRFAWCQCRRIGTGYIYNLELGISIISGMVEEDDKQF
ncbi:Hypothetical predicted protein [Olea europaea subsp. europaea]|uniref:Uncharacterized protein n=1 Tax=Olea europaea subsp. europaea TaxID=158383 RepID=A0A8S0PFI8_OLEEU|nr:Hypothetical predicted protein [Olea europaea subsp. europaea]